MTDGYSAYRSYENRLRCWAHLIRKMRGIKESCDLEVAKKSNRLCSGFGISVALGDVNNDGRQDLIIRRIQ